MKFMKLLSVFFVVALMAVTTHADDVICDSNCTLIDDVDGNVIVTDGATANLDGITVNGNVIVETDSSVSIFLSTIEGNVQAEEAKGVNLADTDVAGDVQIKKSSGLVFVQASVVFGNVQIEENDSDLIAVFDSLVVGDVQAFKNVKPFGFGVIIFENTIGGNLQCAENDPDAFILDNDVTGDIECED